MHITSIGIDLGKTTFHLVALDDRGKVVIKRKFSRTQLLTYTANLPPALLGIEACSAENLRRKMVLGNRAIYQDWHARIIIEARRPVSN